MQDEAPSPGSGYKALSDASSLEISYIDELRTVDRDAILDYGQYLRDTGYVYSSEKSRRETEEFLMRQEAEVAAHPERTRAEAVREGLSAIEGEELSRAAAVHEEAGLEGLQALWQDSINLGGPPEAEAMSDDTPLSRT